MKTWRTNAVPVKKMTDYREISPFEREQRRLLLEAKTAPITDDTFDWKQASADIHEVKLHLHQWTCNELLQTEDKYIVDDLEPEKY